MKEKRGKINLVAPVTPPVAAKSPPLVRNQSIMEAPPEIVFTSHPSIDGDGVVLAARTADGFRAWTVSRKNANALINSMQIQLATQWRSGSIANEPVKDESVIITNDSPAADDDAAAALMASDTTILTRVGVSQDGPSDASTSDPFDDPQNVMSGEPVTEIMDRVVLSGVGSVEYSDDIFPCHKTK